MKEMIVRFLLNLLFSLPAIIISLSVHEFSHSFISDKLGDPTARQMGRLTLNPLKHVDPIGFIALLLFRIGWAKPVMVNANHFKKPKRDMALTALAGPISNFLLALIASFSFVALIRFIPNNQYNQILMLLEGMTSSVSGVSVLSVVTVLMYYLMLINIGLGVFNLIPIPPLDGSKILYAFLPNRVLARILPYEKYSQFILILLLWTGVLSTPIHWLTQNLYILLLKLAAGVFY